MRLQYIRGLAIEFRAAASNSSRHHPVLVALRPDALAIEYLACDA
jgi:hypothetical protein